MPEPGDDWYATKIEAYTWWCGDEHCDCTQPRIERITPNLKAGRPFVLRGPIWEGEFETNSYDLTADERERRHHAPGRAACAEYGIPVPDAWKAPAAPLPSAEDEERLEQAMEGLNRLRLRHEAEIAEGLESSLAAVEAQSDGPPSPLTLHPFYRDKAWVVDWLEGNSSLPSDHLRIPVPPPMRLFNPEPNPTVPSAMNVVVLTKRMARGWAPYVGRPFVYVWPCAVDDLGRTIAGDSKMVYTEETDRG